MFKKLESEGGCGVIGLACAEKISGRHLLTALTQMRNRGNGKGGGIAAVGLSPQAFGVSKEVLETHYLLGIGYLDQASQKEVERACIDPIFDVSQTYRVPRIANFASISSLSIPPPEAVLYFVRVKKSVIEAYRHEHQVLTMADEPIEDEIVYQNSYRLNHLFYAAAGEKKAFVLSHGKNLLVLKLVGFGDDVIHYYRLEDFQAHVWIGHHRYPTKGKVWHPGGAHPFVGLHEALVHNGDFANYFSTCEYLAQRNIQPMFLTDTEVSALLFDLLHRAYEYPLEYVIEALAPTTERDFDLLPKEKQRIYEILRKTHMHGSPDGPWFFLIAQSIAYPQTPFYRLIGMTDTSMLRPQVFALQKGPVPIGLAASEKQAIDAALTSLSKEDHRFWPCADYYWNARGGSYQDGGTFSFTVHPGKHGEECSLVCSDKFGNTIHSKPLKPAYQASTSIPSQTFPDVSSHELLRWVKDSLFDNAEKMHGFLIALIESAISDQNRERALQLMTKLLHQPHSGQMRRSCFSHLINQGIDNLLSEMGRHPTQRYVYLSKERERPPAAEESQILVINALGYPAEGPHSLALEIVGMYRRGFKKMILYHCQGQRFIGNRLGANTHGLSIDVYGSSGDYLASGIDGAIIHVHGSAQDQVAQIMKSGTLVIHGDVGQTFMYGAKGGSAFIRGNAAGRPLINAVGKPRVVINGTCLDYLAESFMAGDPLNGGGFVIVNGLAFNQEGGIVEQETPYPGNNLFSLGSGGAVYLRDPARIITEEQLNGGRLSELEQRDWELILPYLKENEGLFGIPVSRLLEYKERTLDFKQAYRKVSPAPIRALNQEEAWAKGK